MHSAHKHFALKLIMLYISRYLLFIHVSPCKPPINASLSRKYHAISWTLFPVSLDCIIKIFFPEYFALARRDALTTLGGSPRPLRPASSVWRTCGRHRERSFINSFPSHFSHVFCSSSIFQHFSGPLYMTLDFYAEDNQYSTNPHTLPLLAYLLTIYTAFPKQYHGLLCMHVLYSSYERRCTHSYMQISYPCRQLSISLTDF